LMTDAEVYARIREAGGPELCDRLRHLDAVQSGRPHDESALRPPGPGTHCDFDVVIAGGGLWMALAPLLAWRGFKVAVLERARAGAGHREWKAGAGELRFLVTSGLLSADELAVLTVARYRSALCRFHGGGVYPVEGVLDHAVDASGLLAKVRRQAIASGVAILDNHAVVAEAGGAGGVSVQARGPGGRVELSCRVMVDARGAASPYATGDLICPTVGGVLSGLFQGSGVNEVDPAVGEILATVSDVEHGRQHIWECFPGRPGEVAVYLFHYARRGEPISLARLYARFFATLATYKRGDARLLRPTFGLIPGWSRLSAAPRSPHPNVLLVGDAAARHSPLTLCGFGAALRSLTAVAEAITTALCAEERPTSESRLLDSPVNGMTGALAHLLASPGFTGDEVNRLLDAAFSSLHALGNQQYAALLRDEMSPAAFVRFLAGTAVKRPRVFHDVVRGLGAEAVARWGVVMARSLFAKQQLPAPSGSVTGAARDLLKPLT
jgi:lycopene cyclase CruA